MKLVAMIGNHREESYNFKLVRFMQERYAAKIEMEILPIQELPFYTQGDEKNPPERVKTLIELIKESDGILFATPEYNASIPAVLKNAIDWFSSAEKVLVDKPAMIVGASEDVLGTVKAQLQLRQILNAENVSTRTLPANEVYIGSIHKKMDENGLLTDASTITNMDTAVENFNKWILQTVESKSSF